MTVWLAGAGDGHEVRHVNTWSVEEGSRGLILGVPEEVEG